MAAVAAAPARAAEAVAQAVQAAVAAQGLAWLQEERLLRVEAEEDA
jgi:hypothetical protein